MLMQGYTRRFGIVHVFIFVIFAAPLYEETPTRNQRSVYEPGCKIWTSNFNKCKECRDGYFGTNCQLTCRYPNVGKNCQGVCDCDKEYCNITYGCEENAPSLSKSIPPPTVEQFSAAYSSSKEKDCPKGFFGNTCDMPCRFPSFGDHCQSGCNCSALVCNHVSGCDVSANKTNCLSKEGSRKRSNGMFYSMLGLSAWTAIQFFVYLYLSFCYKSYFCKK